MYYAVVPLCDFKIPAAAVTIEGAEFLQRIQDRGNQIKFAIEHGGEVSA
jgi:hypothetical protein